VAFRGAGKNAVSAAAMAGGARTRAAQPRLMSLSWRRTLGKSRERPLRGGSSGRADKNAVSAAALARGLRAVASYVRAAAAVCAASAR
jgi:hypothetical protein